MIGLHCGLLYCLLWVLLDGSFDGTYYQLLTSLVGQDLLFLFTLPPFLFTKFRL